MNGNRFWKIYSHSSNLMDRFSFFELAHSYLFQFINFAPSILIRPSFFGWRGEKVLVYTK